MAKSIIKRAAVLLLFMPTSALAASAGDGSIPGAILALNVIVIQVSSFIVALAAMVGVYYAFTGVQGIADPQQPGQQMQNLGKVLAGIVLASLMAWMTMFLSDLGVQKQQSAAVYSGFQQ